MPLLREGSAGGRERRSASGGQAALDWHGGGQPGGLCERLPSAVAAAGEALASDDAVDPLAKQIERRVRHVARIEGVDEQFHQACRKTETVIHGAHEWHAPVAGQTRHIERG